MRFAILFGLALTLGMSAAHAQEMTTDESASAKAAVSNAITYQGRLVFNGVPVTQNSDLRFTLHSTQIFGSVVAGPVQVDNVEVSAGVFTARIDFGAGVFNGDERWLQIDVRTPHDPGNTNPFTTLTPRQELTAVPYALHALNGGGGSGNWQLSGGIITNVGSTRVLINRTNIIGSEYFGFNAPTTGYGGMYISTDGDSGKPFYGYKAGASAALWTYQDGASGEWRLYNAGERLAVKPTGELTVGSTVEIDNSDPSHFGGQIQLKKSTGTVGLQLNGAGGSGAQGGSISLFNDTNATATAVLDGEYGGAAGGALVLRNSNGATSFELGADFNPGERGLFRMFQPDGTKTVEIDCSETGTADQGATLKLYDDQGNLTIELDADFGASGEGRITAEVIEITGGADFSEQFDVSPASQGNVEPGSVVSIDPRNAGDLCLSNSSYDTKVAGIISGAGGVKPGMLMGQRGTEADGAHPVALTGRVYCKVDASFGAIEPGDLLTTSPNEGHAMKVSDHDRAPGAIIGKAMTGLDSGTGLVLVLVSLQ